MNREHTNKPLQSLRVVPDTSIIVDGFLSRKIEAKEIVLSEVIIHEAVLAELESQANKNKESGYLGLEEIKKVREFSKEKGFKIVFKGNRPTEFEIKHAKTGEIDSLIRSLAFEEKATLITADKVQALVAQSRGIEVILFTFLEEDNVFMLDKYFDEHTQSISIKENCPVIAKKGSPGKWFYEEVAPPKDKETLKAIAKEIIEETIGSDKGFIDSEKKGSTILQYKNNKIAITRPPLSNSYEITCARMIKQTNLEDYSLSNKITGVINSSKGILIASSSIDGKTCFAQALAKNFSSNQKSVILVESPRNEKLSDNITQLSLNQGSSVEISDVLAINKPDFVVFDEVKSSEEFRLFCETRLSGIQAACVLSSSDVRTAIQRFLNKVDFLIAQSIIETIVFIKTGRVEVVLSVLAEGDKLVLKNIEFGKKEFEVRKTEDGVLFNSL